MTEKIHNFFVAFDAIASEISLRFRVLLKWITGVLIAVQVLLAADLPVFAFLETGKWPTYVGILNAFVAYFTLRSGQQAKDLAEVKRVGGSVAMARVPTPGPGAVGAIPRDEMVTPDVRPVRRKIDPGALLVILVSALVLVACPLPPPVIDIGVCTAARIQSRIEEVKGQVRMCLANRDFMDCLDTLGLSVGKDVVICTVREFTGVSATPATAPDIREHAQEYLRAKGIK